MAKEPFRVKLANGVARFIAGGHSKAFIPALDPFDSSGSFPDVGRLRQYTTKPEQLSANMGWCYTANSAIADPCAAVKFKLYRKKKDGDKEEISQHEILDLLESPNLVHTGEQLFQLHHTYMNFLGESYIYMNQGGKPFEPAKGKLPDALQIFPSHQVQFKLGDKYSESTVKFGQTDYPITSVIRDINPDPNNPYFGRSVIAASASTIDTENQMKDWNRRIFANMARPSLIFSADQPLSTESYNRWKDQFSDEHTGTENAFKPLLIEGGKATPYMFSASDLDFLNSRKFSKDEILAMWKVSPGVLGMTENVNRANLEAGFYIHALINVVPRVRQLVRQINATLVQVYDPELELGFENPVPEDVEAKLEAATAGVNKWWTIDEVRDMYGEKPLPDGAGEQIIVTGAYSRTLQDVIDGVGTAAPNQPGAGEPNEGDPPTEPSGKALSGVKKKTLS